MKRLLAAALAILIAAAPAMAASPFAGMSDDDMVASMEAAVKKKTVEPSYVNAMIGVLNDDAAGVRVRERAAWALGEIKAKTAVPALLKASEHKGLLIRSAALGALERLRPDAAIPVLLNVAENDPVLSLRQRATVWLGLFRSDKTIQSLVRLSSDEKPEIRGAAALAMGALQSKRNDFRAALKEMTSDESSYVKDRAEAALDTAIGATPNVLSQLKSTDSDIRLMAALYFDKAGGKRELEVLKDAWNTDPDDDVRDELSRAIVSTKKRVALEKKRAAQKKAAAKAKKAGAAGS
ncbi:MAG: HEAT repeat domain-containing protein, partial [Elusimicrobia bacterium]|nr:HEAT repeat domain-containing protein [Elusimicrobiota bacterium]